MSGADDDASGSATVLEVFRILMKNDFTPDRTVEFHAYAAEEVGLRGSAAVAKYYSDIGRDVVSMVQFDMVGFPKNTNTPIGLTQDFVDSTLTAYVGKLINAYSIIPWESSTCGYACSDHASFQREGYPASFPFENKFGDHNRTCTSPVKPSWLHAQVATCRLGPGLIAPMPFCDGIF